MRLQRLRLQHFRNHTSSTFEFGNGTNLFLGDNGQGKTNILEAISYLCLTKSFYASGDPVVLQIGSDFFEVEGSFSVGSERESVVRVAYDRLLPAKAFFINKKSIEPFSSVIGKYPVVICSPEHNPVTAGGPEERRKFCDFVISQANPVYFRSLIEYRRIVKQRNKILLDAKLSGSDPSSLLEPWNEQLLQNGATLFHRRALFVQEFQEILRSAYTQLAGNNEEPTIEYQPFDDPCTSEQEYGDRMRQALTASRREELRVGSTLVGPHRDELVFKINGLEMRKYGSQGQHKTFLVGLKLGEFQYLKSLCDESPLLLLDDIFSELDQHRSARLLEAVETMSQTFITSTALQGFDSSLKFDGLNKKYVIRNGSVVSHQEEVMV